MLAESLILVKSNFSISGCDPGSWGYISFVETSKVSDAPPFFCTVTLVVLVRASTLGSPATKFSDFFCNPLKAILQICVNNNDRKYCIPVYLSRLAVDLAKEEKSANSATTF